MKLYLREEIDPEKWNNRIQLDLNENIFCYTWYLDATSDFWAGLVDGDYQTVMPVPYSKKLGVKQFIQPQFTRELNVFGNGFSLDAALNFLGDQFKLFDFRYIESNLPGEVSTRKHQWLSLKDDATSEFSTNARRLIKKSGQNFIYKSTENIGQLLAIFKETAFKKIDTISEDDLVRINHLMNAAFENQKGELIGIYQDEQMVGGGFFFKDKTRITYLKGACTDEAKKSGAMFGLMDFAIKLFNDEYDILDFGGSDIENVATFYKKFGAVDRTYYHYRIDQLPAWFKAAKKLKQLKK